MVVSRAGAVVVACVGADGSSGLKVPILVVAAVKARGGLRGNSGFVRLRACSNQFGTVTDEGNPTV